MTTSFLHGPEVLEIDSGLRPIRTVTSAVIGLAGTAPNADATVFPLNTPVLVSGSRTKASKLGATGSLPTAIDGIFDQIGATVVVVRVEEGADEAATLTNLVGSATGFTGVHGFMAAESTVGVIPKILIAPEFTHQTSGGNANPVVSELLGLASSTAGIGTRLRAVVIADGPNTDDADAIQYAADHGSSRLLAVDPWVKVYKGGAYSDEPASARVAGLIAKSDAERGFWWSPSNQPISGIVGTSRPVPFALGDQNSTANTLNEQKVTSIIREDGFRLWGNRGTGPDGMFQFLSVRRTADMIQESLLRSHLWAVDRCINKTYLQDVKESVNQYLRSLKARGAIIGGECWVDPEANTLSSIAAGNATFNFDFTPAYPSERVTFNSLITNDYLTEFVFDISDVDNTSNITDEQSDDDTTNTESND
tara:strand:+ start:149 stop:1414 length:1266 start_codon:yes stop_codon:yes gene_type:complete